MMNAMTNANLIYKIEHGTARQRERRVYVERIWKLKDPPPCKYGHFECALVEDGPCSDEVRASIRSDRYHDL